MNEIKRRVVLASVLKPVDDTRMFEKIAVTLAQEGFEVFIIGYPSQSTYATAGITLLPLPAFGRLSLRRLIMPWKIFRKINELNPEVIIINTPEILAVTVLNKILYKRKVVYDILENYYRTIRHTNTYPKVIRAVLAAWVRFSEIIFAPFVDAFFLAEKGYARELKFIRQPVILENRLPKNLARTYPRINAPYYRLLFSGTLSPSTGVFEAIRLAKELHKINPAYTLTIIGYAAKSIVRSSIREAIADAPFIKLIGGDCLVPHHEILSQISQAGTGVIIYPANPATESSIPTKLYEYLALKLPVIISHTPETENLVQTCQAGVILTPGMPAQTLNEHLAHGDFAQECPDELFWDSQADRLLAALG